MTRFALTAVAALALTGSLTNTASASDLSRLFGSLTSCRDGNCQSSPMGSLNLGPLSLSFGQQSQCNGGNCRTPGLPMARPACPTSAPQMCGPQGCTPRQPTVYGRPQIRPRAAYTTPSGMPLSLRTRR